MAEDRYFIVLDEKIKRRHHALIAMDVKFQKAFRIIKAEFDLQASYAHSDSTKLRTGPSLADALKYRHMLDKSNLHAYRPKSKIGKRWTQVLNELNVVEDIAFNSDILEDLHAVGYGLQTIGVDDKVLLKARLFKCKPNPLYVEISKEDFDALIKSGENICTPN